MSIPGTKELLFGPPGSGKSHSVQTYLDADPKLEVCMLLTEPSAMTILGNTDSKRLHWHYVSPSLPKWNTLLKNAEMIRDFSVDKLFGLAGMEKSSYSQFISVLKVLSDFECQRCSAKLGAADTWDTNRVLVLDSLSGLNEMAMELVVGGKPGKTLPEWGVAIDQEAKLINMLTLGLRCHFCLIAHVDREVDQVYGGTKIYPSALGRKLPQSMGRFFDDVIYSSLEGTKFQWATIAANADSKSRILPLSKDLPPTFVKVIEGWKSKGGVIP